MEHDTNQLVVDYESYPLRRTIVVLSKRLCVQVDPILGLASQRSVTLQAFKVTHTCMLYIIYCLLALDLEKLENMQPKLAKYQNFSIIGLTKNIRNIFHTLRSFGSGKF